MAQTPRGYPYPDGPGSPNNVPLDLQQLAESVDSDVQSLIDGMAEQHGKLTFDSAVGITDTIVMCSPPADLLMPLPVYYMLEVSGTVNVSGVTAAGRFRLVAVSEGTDPGFDVIDRARLPFHTTSAIGGSAKVGGWVVLTGGTIGEHVGSCHPALLLEEEVAGTANGVSATFQWRLRPLLGSGASA